MIDNGSKVLAMSDGGSVDIQVRFELVIRLPYMDSFQFLLLFEFIALTDLCRFHYF